MKAEAVLLPWASQLFGRRCARLSFTPESPVLSTDALSRFHIVEAKVAASDTALTDELVALGFRFAEGEVEFEWVVPAGPQPQGPQAHEVATEQDIPALRDIARHSFHHSRFQPPWYSAEERGRLYQEWVSNAVLGTHDDTCLLLRDERHPLGFVTLRRTAADSARVGLLAAAPEHTGRGVGLRLIRDALRWSANRGVTRLAVATQASNSGAVRFYQRCGARVTAISYWMYRWQ